MIKEILDKYIYYIKQHQLTQQEAADMVHISRTHLSRVLRGERAPSMALLQRMENVMEYGESHKK